MKRCCLEEAKQNLKRHRDVATCDECGSLLLAYDNNKDFDSTVTELRKHGIDPETGKLGKLKLVAKPESP